MATRTTNLNLYKPVVGGDTDNWGGFLNNNAAYIDALFAKSSAAVTLHVNNQQIDGTSSYLFDSVKMGDDRQLQFGAAPDYWLIYDNSNTQFELNSTNVDGGGTDGVVFSVSDGTDDVAFTGKVSTAQVDILAEGDLRLQDASGGQYVGFDAPATVSGSYTLTLPAAVGSVNQVLSLSNTDGTLQWATPEVGDITSVVAGTGLSGGGTSGAVTLNVEASQTQITSVGALNAGSITSGFGAIDVGSSAISGGAGTLSSLSVGDGNITNVGDIALDSISSDGSAIGIGASGDTVTCEGAWIFNEASADVDFRVEGNGEANLLFVDASTDRVGIGTNAPSDILDVQKNQNATTNFYLRNTDTTNTSSRAYLNVVSGDRSLAMGAINGDHTYINASSGADLYFQDGGTNNMVISGAGRVGIGTTAPNSYYSGSNKFVIANTGGSTGMTFATSNTGQARIDFAEGTSGAEQYRGTISYNHAATESEGYLRFVAGGAEALRLGSNYILMANLPTSDPGVANSLWNDSGTLKISAG